MTTEFLPKSSTTTGGTSECNLGTSTMPDTMSVSATNRHLPQPPPSTTSPVTSSSHSARHAPDQDLLLKRYRNNAAAKKYRQKKVDRIKELEAEVDEVKRERDDLRIRLARQEAETAALREMLAGRLGRSADIDER